MSVMSDSPSDRHHDIRTALRTVQQSFLDAIVEGADALSRFHTSWMDLRQRIETAQKLSSLDAPTIHLAHTVAQDVAVIGDHFLGIQATTSSLHSELVVELGVATEQSASNDCMSHTSFPPFRRQPKPSLQKPRHPTTPITSALAPILPTRKPSATTSITESTRSTSDPNPLPEFIEHAYKFLVANIFNPYPTRAEKEAIVTQTSNERVTFSSISNWFANARRRCGWTTILKERCDGNREQLVALATRVFVNPDPEDPVDPEITRELMEMKEAVETMYERKTRASAWIQDLDNLQGLLHPSSGASTEKPRGTAEGHRREQDAQKKDREFERQKRRMQTEALRKADKVTKMIQREQAKQKKQELRAASFTPPHPPQRQLSDDEPTTEPIPVAGGKRKLVDEDDNTYRFPDLPRLSPVSSRSSSFISDLSSEGRVPSLTWSDSGDERPYKRSRSSPVTPPKSHSDSPRLSPALEVPTNLNYSFNFDPPGLAADPSAFDTLFDFSVAPCETLMVHGKKRPHDHAEDEDPTPHAKRRRSSRPIIASVGPDLPSLPPSSTSPSTPAAPSTPLFTPRQSFDATPTQSRRKRSLQFPDLETVLGLDLTQPPPVQIAAPDASLPLDVGVFNWSSDGFGDVGAGEAHADFSQLLQLFGSDQTTDTSMGMSHFDLTSTAFLPQGQIQHNNYHPTLPDDLSGLVSGLMSEEALHDMGMDFTTSLTATPDLSRESYVAPIGLPVAPAMPTQDPAPSPTPAELADKALKRERKRKELEQKRAELESERARLAELERELEDE